MPKYSSFPLGIDLGNDSSTIGRINKKNQIDIVSNNHSNRSTPTCVTFNKQRRYFGEEAQDQLFTNLESTATCMKRLIGLFYTSQYEDIKVESNFVGPQLIKSKNDFIGINLNHLNSKYHFSITQLLSMFFKHLKNVSELNNITGEKFLENNNVTVSCPGWYSDRQRRLIVEAAKVGGFTQVDLLSELNAIAMTYVIHKQDELPDSHSPNRIITFLDIGESTTSMAIMSVNKSEIKTFDKSFNKKVGGRNFDMIIMNKLLEVCLNEHRLSVKKNTPAWFKLLESSKKIKESLSVNSMIQYQIESLQDDIDVLFTIKQSDFEDWCSELIDEIEKQVTETMKRYTKVTSCNIHSVEFTGGCSRIPVLRRRLNNLFNNDNFGTSIPSDDSIAIGTAYFTAMTQRIPASVPYIDIKDINLNDIEFVYTNKLGNLERINAFQRNDFIPNTKVITIEKEHDFMIQANYKKVTNGLKQSVTRNSYGYLSNGSSKFIAQWNIKDIIENLQKQTSNDMESILSTASTSITAPQTKIRLVLKRDINELVTIQDVSLIKEVERVSRRSSITNFLKKIERKKTKEFREISKLKFSSSYQIYSTKEIEEYKEIEESLTKQDHLIMIQERSKSKFEEKFLKLKSSMDYIDELHDGPDKKFIFNYLNKTNDWLDYVDYEESAASDSNFENFEKFTNIYEAKYKELCQLVNRFDIVI